MHSLPQQTMQKLHCTRIQQYFPLMQYSPSLHKTAGVQTTNFLHSAFIYYAPAIAGIKRYRDPPVCLSQHRLQQAGCVAQLPRLSARWLPAASRPPEMCGLRNGPGTDVNPPRVELPSAGAYRLAAPGAITC